MSQSKLKSKQSEKKGSFLWEVKGGTAKMYLNGTVHMVPKNFFPLKNEIMNSFDECNNLVLEIIMEEISLNTINITDDIINNKDYIYEDGDSLYNHFSKEKIMDLRDYLVKNKLCSPNIARKFYKLKPEVIQEVIINGFYNKTGIDQEHIGIDNFFVKRAKAMKKKVLELENEKFQKEILSQWFKTTTIGKGYEKSNGLIKKYEMKENYTILEGKFMRFISLKMIPWVFNLGVRTGGSLYGNEELIKKQRKKLLAKKNPILGNRDEEMCEKIVKLLNTKDSYFVAVGAMHLIGEGSIIDRLEKKGYEVVRIC